MIERILRQIQTLKSPFISKLSGKILITLQNSAFYPLIYFFELEKNRIDGKLTSITFSN